MRSADLHRLSRVLRAIALAASGDPGERPTFGEIAVVEDLAQHGPSPVGTIADRTGVAQSLVSKVVRALEGASIVSSSPDESDARRRVVALAPGVEEQLLRPRGERTVGAAIEQAAPHLAPAERSRAEALLEELVRLLAPPPGH